MLNYRHLHYFWVVTKEGGFARAAERLDMAVQTISAQVRELEKSLGHQLLKPSGRGVALTEAGQAAFARAEEVFQLGQLAWSATRASSSSCSASWRCTTWTWCWPARPRRATRTCA
jgi:LysR family transcriptional regulator, transcriptional activator of nhaA